MRKLTENEKHLLAWIGLVAILAAVVVCDWIATAIDAAK